jgi:Flp pilus assembly pilin Flp
VRRLIRRLRTCEAGSGLLEYALLIAVVALGLIAVLRVFRNSAGGLTNQVAVGVSTRTAKGYGGGGTGGAPIARPAGHRPATPDPDSSSAGPDSSSTPGGGATAILDFRLP